MNDCNNQKLSDKDCIKRDTVLDKIGNILCRTNLTVEQRSLITELGNFIAELPSETIYQDKDEKSKALHIKK